MNNEEINEALLYIHSLCEDLEKAAQILKNRRDFKESRAVEAARKLLIKLSFDLT